MPTSVKSPSARRLFITGTDTDSGKTLVSIGLLRALALKGYCTAALKPVAAGAEVIDGQLGNDDALKLMKAATRKDRYDEVNPFLYAEAIAPHIAAANEQRPIRLDNCVAACRSVLEREADVVIVEGAGGWLVPLNETDTMADVVRELQCEVILVVAIQLGCLNHALLTAQAIRQTGLTLVGWVANHRLPDVNESAANVDTLKQRLNAPLLAEIPCLAAALPSAHRPAGGSTECEVDDATWAQWIDLDPLGL